MDKKIFLDELRKSLRVLKEEELQDIIGEYEQHIDMKVKNGLTVEQAIADFGNVKELASEILEAYHVRAEYSMTDEQDTDEKLSAAQKENVVSSQNTQSMEPEEEPVEETEKTKILSKVNEWLKNVVCKLGFWFHTLWKFLQNICSWCVCQCKRPFVWIKRKWSDWKETRKIKNAEKRNVDSELSDKPKQLQVPKKQTVHTDGLFVRTIRGTGNMMLQLWNWMITMTLWCLHTGWNCCVVFTSLLVAGLGLICLFMTGVLTVLWMQGYPLAGLSIGCLGLVLCLFAAAAFIWTLMWRRTKKEVVEMEESQHA